MFDRVQRCGISKSSKSNNGIVRGTDEKSEGQAALTLRNRKNSAVYPWPVSDERPVQFHPGLDQRPVLPRRYVIASKGNFEKINRMPMKYFESRTYGEVLSTYYQRCRHTGSGTEPEYYYNYHVCGNAGRRSDHDAEYLSADDADRTCDPADFHGADRTGDEESQKFFRDQQEYLGHINGQVEEVYGGHLVIKAFNRVKRIPLQSSENQQHSL